MNIETLAKVIDLCRAKGVTRMAFYDHAEGDTIEITLGDPPEPQPTKGDMERDLAALEAQRRAGTEEPLDEPCPCSPSPTEPHWKEIDHNLGGCLRGCDIAKCLGPK